MIHLDVKTDFSFLKAYGTPEQVISRAKATGAESVGIADFCSTWGHIPFWQEAKKQKIKPLFGVQIPVVENLERTPGFDLVTIIAKNNKGLEAQYKLLSLATEQFYYRPRITWKQLSKLKNNFTIINRITPQTEPNLHVLGNFHIGVGVENSFLMSLALRRAYPVVFACSPVYPEQKYREAYQLMNAIGSARKTYDIDAVDQWMFTRKDIDTKLFDLGIRPETIDEWVETSIEISNQCKASPRIGKNVKPETDKTVEDWCVEGAKQKGIDLDAEPQASRYKREIDLIYQKGFQDYFLMIADLCQWSKGEMFVGPARGSSAGSLVCYLMGIVEVNPLDYGLLFERFIDVNREDLPDIDIDFQDDLRDHVFDYIGNKYGHNRVARIGTVSVFKPKSAINDVSRCYSIPNWEVKKLTEVMVERSGGDARSNMAIEDTIDQFDIGKELVSKYPKIKMATQIEGHARHTGKHAAGIIVSDEDVSKFASINKRDGYNIAMLNKNDAEAIGLLKIDALGLKTLSVISKCCERIGMDPKDLYTLPTDKQEAFKIFQEDRVAGIFQFEGYAVRSLMRQMGVENFNDIVALTALARPGPLHCGAANEFIVRRTGVKDWDYFLPQMKEHTRHTYGTIVYQEQVMSITRDLGDMSWQDVSALRKAMSKSLGEEFFNQYRDKFLKGTRNKGIKDEAAITLWNDMCTFGSWAFNLSHAVSYALVSYWCAYLKSHYPVDYAVSHLSRTESDDHVLRALRELIKEGIKLVPFDPHISQESWSVHGEKIYGGFTAVKGVGPKTASEMLSKRADDPENWIDNLTPAKRSKILSPNNTPWHNINRIQKEYKRLYEDPNNYITDELPKGVDGPIVFIEDIIEELGEYCFVGTIKQRNLRDLNETQSLAKRGGRKITNNELFLNLVVEDDTSSILCTIDRWQYPHIGRPIMEQEADGKDFLIRGKITQEGWRKINIQRIARL